MIEYKVLKHEPVVTANDEKEVNYVIYSHSTFKHVLQMQLDHIIGRGKLTLFINENSDDMSDIYDKFDDVVFYKEGLTYGKKLLSCLKQINHEYMVLIHDNDILFDANDKTVLELLNFLKQNNYDRVDFQLAYDFDRTESETITDDDLYLIKSSNTDTTANGYIYNVNPSIWKRETLIKIMETYGHRDYRTIEHPEVQKFCLQFEVFKLYSKNTFRCGYFTCLEPFKYLHITHYQKLFNPATLPPEAVKDVKDVYVELVDKYDLNNPKLW